MKRRYKPQPVLDKPSGVLLLLDAAFAAIRQRPKEILLLSSLPIVPGAIVAAINYRQFHPSQLVQVFINDAYEYSINGPSVFVGIIVAFVAFSMTLVATNYLVFGWLSGDDFGVKAALRACFKPFVMLLVSWICIVPAITVALLLFVFPGAALTVMLAAIPPVIAIEGANPFKAAKRSWKLQFPRFWSTLGLLVLTLVVAGFYYLIVLWWASAIGFGGSLSFFYVVFVGISFAASVILIALVSVVLCLNYIDARFRTEGLDIAIKAEKVFSR